MNSEKQKHNDEAKRSRDEFVAACKRLTNAAAKLELNDIEAYSDVIERLLELRKLGDVFVFDFSNLSAFPERSEIYKKWDEYRDRKDAAIIRDLRQIENGDYF